MEANTTNPGNELVSAAMSWLRNHLPENWSVTATQSEPDATVELRSSNASGTLLVEAKRSFAPRDVDRLLGAVGRRLRAASPMVSILVVAPWISPRTRELLTSEDVNYLDLTGSARIRLDEPALFISAEGAARDPAPAPRGSARLRGPKAARLIRFLLDVRPPYGVREIASALRLAPGYVSRLLDALDREALIARSRRGGVESVEIDGLLRHWAITYDVFASNDARTYLAPRGAAGALSLIPEMTPDEAVTVTGSFAAVRLAPVAAPALLCAYCDDPHAVAAALDLIPADEGANVALLRPFDPVARDRATDHEGVRYAAPSQVAIDCLTGNGRMPAEGEAVVTWMLASEDPWRAASLTDLAGAKDTA